MKSSKEKIRFWMEHVEAQRTSGKSVLAYCRQNDLKKHNFIYYKRRYCTKAVEPAEPTPKFLPVAVAHPQGIKIKIGGVDIEVHSQTPPSWVAQVIWEVSKLHANS